MARPGVVVTSRAEPPPRSAPTDVGMAFMIGATEKGSDVKQVTSLLQYQTEFGVRQGFTDTYDAAEAYFQEGGGKLTVSRTNGALTRAVPEPIALRSDIAAVPTGTVDEVLAWVGGDVNRAAAAAAVEDQGQQRTTLLDRLDDIMTAPLVVDTGVASALAALTKDLGPGQVFVPGALGQAADTHTALLAHAATNNRIALLDAAPDADATALLALAATLSVDANARYGALWAPGAVIPGLTSADTRTVAFSVTEAGIIARNDVAYSPNVAAAGVNGQSRFAIDLEATFTDAQRESLNDAGVDIAKSVYGAVRAYGYRTLADPDTQWSLLSNARLNMEIVAKAEEIGERYLFTQIDGRRIVIGQFGADLTGMLIPYYEAGSLFGDSAADAFYVDVGPAVNTLETIAAGDLRAIIGARMSPFAEYVVIEIVKVATETPLAVAA